MAASSAAQSLLNLSSKTGRNMPTVYLLPSAIPREISGPVYKVGYSICAAMAEVIGSDKVDGAQFLNSTWRLQTKDFQSKTTLLTNGLSLAGYSIQCLGKSPYLVDGKETIKLIIGNISLNTPDDDIKAALTSLGIKFGSELYWECYSDKSNKLTTFKTGRRFVYIATPDTKLPRFVKFVSLGKPVKAWLKLSKEDESLYQEAAPVKSPPEPKAHSFGNTGSGERGHERSSPPKSGGSDTETNNNNHKNDKAHTSSQVHSQNKVNDEKNVEQQENPSKDEEGSLETEKPNEQHKQGKLFSVGTTPTQQTVIKSQLPSSGKPRRVADIPGRSHCRLSRSATNLTNSSKISPSDNKNVTLDKKKNFTERRRSCSLKRDREGTNSRCEPGSNKKKVKGEVFSFSFGQEFQKSPSGEGQSKPKDEHILFMKEIINEVLSRIKY